MAYIKLDVPVLAQEKDNCCWHTSAMMIWLYWQRQTGRQGPMNTNVPVYLADTGLQPHDFINLAKTVGLNPVPAKSNFTAEELVQLLTDKGPLWSAGYWFGVPHVIVLTGACAGTVFFNDPDGAKKKVQSLAWFNVKLASSIDDCLMAKDPDAY